MFKLLKAKFKISLIGTLVLLFLFSALAFKPCLASPFLNKSGVDSIGGPAVTTGGWAGFDTSSSLPVIIYYLIMVALSLLAIIMIILVIVSGYQWMTAGGNEDTVKTAQSRIKNAIIGVVIILAAYAITYFVFSILPFNKSISSGGNGSQLETTFQPYHCTCGSGKYIYDTGRCLEMLGGFWEDVACECSNGGTEDIKDGMCK